MERATKRNFKTQEFAAHGGAVTCLQFGRKSGRVFVTGGDDRMVNLWLVGQQACRLHLSGHQSAVESACFDSEETSVVAGSATGAIKMWDIEQAKAVRTYAAHKSHCTCVDFHPYGAFFASGCVDSSLKLWDVRRASPVHAYYNHGQALNVIRFSPDGRWIALGAEDGVVRLWELSTGKVAQDFRGHTGPITTLEFHPREFLLATGSADGTVRMWDLETFQLASSSDAQASPVRSLTFHPDGDVLFSGSKEALKVFGVDPVACYDVLPMNWNKVADMAVAGEQVLGASFTQNFVGVWSVPFQYLRMSENAPDPRAQPSRASERSVSSASNQVANPPRDNGGRSTPVQDRARSAPSREPSVTSLGPSAAHHTEDKHTAFARADKIERERNSPPRADHRGANAAVSHGGAASDPLRLDAGSAKRRLDETYTKPVVVPPTNPSIVGAPRDRPMGLDMQAFLPGKGGAPEHYRTSATSSHTQSPVTERALHTPPLAAATTPDRLQREREASEREQLEREKERLQRDRERLAREKERMERLERERAERDRIERERADRERQERERIDRELASRHLHAARADSRASVSSAAADPFHGNHPPSRPDTAQSASSLAHGRAGVRSAGSERDAPASRDSRHAARELPVSSHTGASYFGGEDEVMGGLSGGHSALVKTIGNRLNNLRVVRSLWAQRNYKGAVEALADMNDTGAAADVLSILNMRPSLWTLDVSVLMAPLMQDMLASGQEPRVTTACRGVTLVLETFGKLVKETLSAPTITGVDITREERLNKCRNLHERLLVLRSVLQNIATARGGKSAGAAAARECLVHFEALA